MAISDMRGVLRNLTVDIAREVAELPDRTSPHDQLDHMLVSAGELELICEHRLEEAWDAAIEAAALMVDECNREGPYNAIGAASRIRDLKARP